MRVVIVGAGPAGLTCAETLRRHDRAMDITLLSAEPSPPYSPPAMVDYLLHGREETLFWKGRDVCERLRLDFRPARSVTGVRPDQRVAVLDDGTALAYDRLVVASGSRPHAPVPGSELPGVTNFKSLAAASALVDRVRSGAARRAAIVGAGFIGIEVAFLLAELGVAVTIVEALDRVMPRMLDRETAEIVSAELARRGVALRLGTPAAAFVGARAVEHVELASGEALRADIYVAATGIKPTLAPLAGSGVATAWGVLVDERLRTSVPAISAAGDVAETPDRMTGERWVHANFPNAVAQGEIVALDILGHDARYQGAESMNSLKHVGVPVIAAGAQTGEEELRWRSGDALRKLWITDGRIVGFRLAGDIRGAGVYRSLMLRRLDVTPYRRRLLGHPSAWPPPAA